MERKRIHPDMRYPQSVRPETERRIAYPCASCGRLCGNAGTYPRLCGRHGRIEHRPCLGRTYAWRTSQPVPPVESCTLLQIREPLPHGTEAQQPGHPPHHHQRAGHLAERHPPLHAQRSGSSRTQTTIPQAIKIIGVSDWVVLSIQIASFYSFHIKTVRSPYRKHTVSIWRTYGFDMENVKRRQSETETEPFNHTFIRIC